jgi:hypothetical protein
MREHGEGEGAGRVLFVYRFSVNWEVRMTQRSGKTATVAISLWFDEEAGDIHLSFPDHGLSTVNASPESKRGHPHLFNKLAKLLRDQGKPHPPIVEEWNRGRGG